jgi:hypothetical protein
MAGIQQMCAKIGLVTTQGLSGTLKNPLPKTIIVPDAVVQLSQHS